MSDDDAIPQGSYTVRGKQRIKLWTEDLTDLAKDADFLEVHAVSLVQLMLHTLPIYQDSASQRAVLATVKQAVTNGTFLKTLAGAIVKLDPDSVSRQECFVLLCWTAVVLRQLQVSCAKKAVIKLVECQAAYLSRLQPMPATAENMLKVTDRLLSAKPDLLPEYVAVAKSKDSPGLMYALLHFGSQHPKQLAPFRQELLAFFCESALGAKLPVSAEKLDAYSPLAGQLSQVEFGSTVLPAILKYVRRTPDAALVSIKALLSATQLDLSSSAHDLMDQLLKLVRGSKESVRQAALDVVKAAAGRIHSTDALTAEVHKVQHILDGTSEGRVKNGTERAALVGVLTALCAAPAVDAAMQQLAEAVTDFLATFYKDEANDDVKSSILVAIGSWLKLTNTLPPSVSTRLAGCLKEKDALKSAALKATLQALQANSSIRSQAISLAAPLARLVEDGASKLAQRATGVSALLACCYLAAASHEADEVFKQHKVWSIALKEDSSLLTPATLAKLPLEDAACVAQLCSSLLLQHGHYLDQAASRAVSRLLLAVLLHYAAPVRRAGIKAVSQCLAEKPNLADGFVAALQHWQKNSSRLPVAADPASAADDQAGPTPATLSLRYAAAAMAVIPTSPGAISPPLLARIMLAAHHTVICNARRHPQAAWNSAKRRIHKLGEVFDEKPQAVVDIFFSSDGINSANPAEQRAANLALSSAMADAPNTIYPALHSALTKAIDHREHDAISPTEVKIFFTPAGIIAIEPDVHAVALPGTASGQVLSSRPAVANGHAPPAKKAAPSRTVSSSSGKGVASSKGGKAPGSKAKDPIQERKEAQLADEAQTRADIQAIKDRLDKGLTALASAVTGNQAYAAKQLDDLKPFVLPLLASPVVGEGSAYDAAYALARCLPGALHEAAFAVASALQMVVQSRQEGTPLSELSTRAAMVTTMQAMAAVTANSTPLAGPCYDLCFPVLEAVLSSSVHTPLHEQALQVMSLHVAPGLPLPRKDTLAVLFHVLGVVPAYREKIGELLSQVCSGVGTEEVAAALQGLLAAAARVRAAAIVALLDVPVFAEGACPNDDNIVVILWLACHDPFEDNAEAAADLWEYSGAHLAASFVQPLIHYLGHANVDVRSAAATALAAGLEKHPTAAEAAMQLIVADYDSALPRARSGAALAVKACASHFGGDMLMTALHFLLEHGLADMAHVQDQKATVSEQMMQAGAALVNAHGKSQFQPMLQLFEGYLDKKDVADEARYDKVREGAIVFLGTLARHLDPSDSKVQSIVGTLLEALPTPSYSVQEAVSDCLAPLMSGLATDKSYVQSLAQRLLDATLSGPDYPHRRGSAWGLAGLVKGLGIGSLKTFGILERIKDATEDQKSVDAREGALSAVECLTYKLGRLFEPYVIHVIGKLLNCYSDSARLVREGAHAAARAIMGNLSGQGVKLVLPAILQGVDDSAWRTKQGSIELLGTMAYLAPKQLSTSLPTVVPILGKTLSDPHPKVQASAKKALEEIGGVIRNPEVQKLVKPLLLAIANPNKHAKAALDILLQTVFINTVDAPSLALIVPVVHRGLRDRSGDAKKKAARIVGNMCALINEPKDMAPYVPLLMPELKAALIDPLPEVRATAAKALGSLLKGMGQHYFEDVMPWLLETLKSEGSSVERSGAAQGLAEVLAVLGPAHVEALLPEIVDGTKSKSPFVREGHLTLFKFLPLAIPQTFQEHLTDVLPSILDGLADEAEGVRDAALAAGRTFVDLYAETALPLLLPAVEDGILNDNWRIRQSSVELLGQLLFKVAGTSGKVQQTADEDAEGISSDAHGAAITEALGIERRNEVLALLFMARADVGYTVRQAAVHVWKTIVTNTPKTTGEILKTLMEQIITSLGHFSEERQQMAGRCLGELVRKMGDRVLQQIIPILVRGMQDPEASTRQGVCTGLKEVLDNISREQLQEYLAQLLPTVQAALCDEDTTVRQAAGGAFSILFKGGTGGAVDSIIPTLLHGLDGNAKQSAQALEGLRVILGVRPQTLATMVPKLLRGTLTSTNCKALGSLAEVAGPAIAPHLSNIFPPLLRLASQPNGSSAAAAAAKDALLKVAASVGEDALYLLFAELEKGLEDPVRRPAAAAVLTHFCATSKLDYQEHVPSLLTSLVVLMAEDSNQEVLVTCWQALAAVAGSIPKEMMPSYVRTLKEAVSTAREKERRKRRPLPLRVAGFCLPKALQPMLPIFLQGVLQAASAELRESAAEGLGELVDITSEETLKPFVVQITGPMIRIIGDRLSWEIKAALLHTIGLLIAKAGPGLKPFVPQLQTTFLKCLGDQARQVRQSAAENLGELTRMSMRVDQLATDLINNAKLADPAIQEAYLTALRGMLLSTGQRLSPAVLSKAGETLQSMMAGAGENEEIREKLAAGLGAFAQHCSVEEVRQMLAGPVAAPSGQPGARMGAALIIANTAQFAPQRLQEAELSEQAVAAVVKLSRDPHIPTKLAAAKATGNLLLAELDGHVPEGCAMEPLVPVLIALLGRDQNSEVQRQGLQVIRRICLAKSSALEPHWAALLPSLCSLAQDTAGPTKLATERTLARILQLEDSTHKAEHFVNTPLAGSLVRGYLTDMKLRSLSKLTPDGDDAL
ncbi:TPA: hypothetical protein ACH3X3_006274 [Trebouxia sp. C0006]